MHGRDAFLVGCCEFAGCDERLLSLRGADAFGGRSRGGMVARFYWRLSVLRKGGEKKNYHLAFGWFLPRAIVSPSTLRAGPQSGLVLDWSAPRARRRTRPSLSNRDLVKRKAPRRGGAPRAQEWRNWRDCKPSRRLVGVNGAPPARNLPEESGLWSRMGPAIAGRVEMAALKSKPQARRAR